MNNIVCIREVGLRDGLQLIRSQLATGTKAEWMSQQVNSGFGEMEVTSFVPAHILPQFFDATEVLSMASCLDGLCPSVLVPNLRGGKLALGAGAKKINFVISVSESHNQENVRCTTEKSFQMLDELILEAKEKQNVSVTGALSTSFGCSIEGDIKQHKVVRFAERMARLGVQEINLADTVGYANPLSVKNIFADLQSAVGEIPLAAHFHDTRGLGLANIFAAFEVGITRFDSCLGGLGGCPFAPGASGNVNTEDTVGMFHSMGIDTGVDIEKLIEVRRLLETWLPNEKLGGNLIKTF
jgi:hydroxymethylglutaryl-CoA lyase